MYSNDSWPCYYQVSDFSKIADLKRTLPNKRKQFTEELANTLINFTETLEAKNIFQN